MASDKRGDTPLQVDLVDECVWCGEERRSLPPKAFLVLRHLVHNPQRLVTKSELLETVWAQTHVAEAVLSVAIAQIREALGDSAAEPRLVETVHRRGYRLKVALPLRQASHVPGHAGRTLTDKTSELDRQRTVSLTPSREPHAALELPTLVGRAESLRALHACLDQALTGQRQLVVVTGEAGIGKTVVVDAFVRELGLQSSSATAATRNRRAACLVARGQCLETFGSGEAYLPLLEALAGMARADASGEVVRQLRYHAPSWLVQMPWLLERESLLQLRRELEGGTRERMLRELAEVLEALAAALPLVLILEDMHCSDPSTVACLAYLAQRREAARLLVIVTYRPVDAIVGRHPINALKLQLQSQQLCREVALGFLAVEDVGDYLAARFSAEIAAAVAGELHDQTAGNPLFMINVLDHWVANGKLKHEGTGWQACRDQPGTLVPEGVRHVIEQNLTRLDAGAVALLEAASVGGGEFDSRLLAECSERAQTEVEDICDDLAGRAELIRAAGIGHDPEGGVVARYAFVHALYRNVLYQRMPEIQRLRFHQRLAERLQARHAAPAELAHHLLNARQYPQALTFSLAAGEHAKTVCAFEEAARHFQVALDLSGQINPDNAEEQTARLLSLGEAQQLAGAFGSAEETLLEASQAARGGGTTAQLATAALWLGQGYERLGRSDTQLIRLCEEALDRLGPGASPLRAKILAHLVYVLGPVSNTAAQRQRYGEEAFAIARHLDDPPTLAWVLQYTSWAGWGPQDGPSRHATAREIEDLLPRLSDRRPAMTLLLVLIALYIERGEHELRDHSLARLEAEIARSPTPYVHWFSLRVQTMRAMHEGRLADADRLSHATLAAGQLTDHPNVMPLFGGQRVVIHYLRGELGEAETLLQMAITQNPQLVVWKSVWAYLRFLNGHRTDARRQFDTIASNDFTDIPRDTVWLIGAAYLAMLCAELGDARRAQQLLDLLLPSAERCPGVMTGAFSLGHASRYLALLAATAGDQRAARAYFDRALTENENLHAWPWLAFTQLDYARFLAAQSSKRDQKRSRELAVAAAALAGELGMSHLLAATAALTG